MSLSRILPIEAKSFPTPGDLRNHSYVHTRNWPIRCHVCGRGFSKTSSFKNHLIHQHVK